MTDELWFLCHLSCPVLFPSSVWAMILLSAGSNAQGQLATGDQEDAHEFKPAFFDVQGMPQSTAPGRILQLACGANHTLILLENDPDRSLSIWGAGDGSNGHLGLSTDIRKGTRCFKPLVIMGELPPYEEISIIQASWETSFVVVRSLPHDRILSFGSNDFGLLGTGDTTTASVKDPSTVNEVHLDHLVPQTTSFRVAHLKAGPRHVLAVLQYTKDEIQWEMLIGWGAGRHGQLEMQNPEGPSFDSRQANGPRCVSLPIRITAWTHPTSVVDMSVGNQHALLLLSDGSIAQVGSNSKSQLPSGTGYRKEHYSRVRCSWNNSFVAPGDSESLLIRSYGRNAHGQLGRTEAAEDEVALPSSLKLLDIVCGSEHCLVKGTRQDSEKVELWAWGWNEHGNLALGHCKDVHIPTHIPVPKTDDETPGMKRSVIVGIWAGCGTSWVATED